MASGERNERSIASEPEGAGNEGDRKVPKRTQFARVLIVCRLGLRTNQGRIKLANEANSQTGGVGPRSRGLGDRIEAGVQ